MAIKIQNLRISPYTAKDTLKVVFGDQMELTFAIPHVDGESYMCGLDNERVVYPPSRPICAYTSTFTRDGDNVTFKLNLTTSKLRTFVSGIKKPMPVWLQIVREVNGKYETVLLDDILALPSVIDGAMTVCEGDPLKELLEAKLDKPYAEGTEGQVLTMGEDGHYAWADLPEIPEQEQANWDESDSSEVSYIRNKPDLSIYVEKEAGKGLSSNDYTDADKAKLGGIEDNAQVNVQADWDDSDSDDDAFIRNKPALSTVALTGSYTDLSNKPDLTVYSLVTDTGNKISMSIDDEYDLVVSLLDKNDNVLSTQDIDLPIESMIVDATYANGILTLTLQNGNTVDVDISDIVSGLVPDSRTVNGHALSSDVTITAQDLGLATVATSGSYTDLTDKPHIPDDQVQADWDESDSSEVSYIKNKPSLDFAKNYFTVTANQADSTVKMMTLQNAIPDIEYSTDGGSTWTQLVFTQSEYPESLYFSQTITLANNAKALFRGDNHTIGNGWTGVSRFLFTGQVAVGGKLMSLLDKSCASDTVPNDVMTGVFASLFSCNNYGNVTFEDNMYALVDASELVFPINSYNNAYMYMFANCKGLANVPNCFYQGANVSNGLCSMFIDSGITGKVVLGLTGQLANAVYTGTFEDCTGITKAEILNCIPARYSFLDTFEGCSNLTEITVHFTEWNDSWQWRNPPATGVWCCPKALDVTNRGMTGIPFGWTIEYIDEQPVQSDWDESDSSELSYIKNKPEIPEQVQADWDESDSSEVSFILNKPNVEPKIDELNTFFGNLYKDHEPLTITMHDPSYSQGIRIYYQFTSVPAPHFDLQYSYDKQTWYDFEYTEAAGGVWSTTVAYIGNGYASDHVYIRGNNDTNYVDGGGGNICYFVFNMTDSSITNAVKLSGNLYSIFRKENYWNILDFNSLGGSNQYGCYSLFRNTGGMGKYVNNIIDAGDLIMPAIKLKNWMCSNMFRATSITRAPYLPATFLASSCYDRMFYSCPNLQEISVGFTNWKGTNSWVEGVGSTGVFKCPYALDTTQTGANAIPSGWTVETI